jgi:hypothetical protein
MKIQAGVSARLQVFVATGSLAPKNVNCSASLVVSEYAKK